MKSRVYSGMVNPEQDLWSIELMGALTPGREIRSEFPIFEQAKTERPLAFLDTAASSQKPRCVIDRMSRYFSSEHSNIHRGAYHLSSAATEAYEHARAEVEAFIGAEKESVIFTRGTTEGINLVSYSLGSYFKEGDCILLSILEHHSNIVPWQLLAKRKKLRIEFVDCDKNGLLTPAAVKAAIEKHSPRLVAVTQQSNALGAVVDSQVIAEMCRKSGALFLIDGAQSVLHLPVNLKELQADFFVFSGHKLYGPTGIGGLYIRPERLELLEPFLGGGDMIETVTTEGSTFAHGIQRFEAGTPPIAEAIGLGTAIEFIKKISRNAIKDHEANLFEYAWGKLSAVPGITLLGPRNSGGEQRSIIPFLFEDVHPHDLATVADSYNVQFRAGHHCAMPLMKRLGLTATARISFGVYSVEEDIDQLVQALEGARKIFCRN